MVSPRNVSTDVTGLGGLVATPEPVIGCYVLHKSTREPGHRPLDTQPTRAGLSPFYAGAAYVNDVKLTCWPAEITTELS